MKHFECNEKRGLTEKQAAFRLSKNGKNILSQSKKTSAWDIFSRQFKNLFIWLLLVAAIISYFVDGSLQAGLLLFIVALNLGLGFFQEYKAEQSIADLEEIYETTAPVIRDGVVKKIASAEIVIGDLIELATGNKIPADARIIFNESLSVDESSLTGESLPVSKDTQELSIDTVLAERNNMVYAGTLVVSGHGRAVVVATGVQTEFGKIASSLDREEEPTQLERQVAYLGKKMASLAIFLAAIIIILGRWRGIDNWELLTFAIALFVGMVPESLPTAITLSLSLGVSRMSKKKAIVRRLASVETLGSVNIIATDKTGTITKNEINLDKIVIGHGSKFDEIESAKINANSVPQQFLLSALACSNAEIGDLADNFSADPIDAAIARVVSNFDPKFLQVAKKTSRLSEVPFDSVKKYMAVVAKVDDKKMLIAKGSAEAVVGLCKMDGVQKKRVLAKASALSSFGYKIIALASKETRSNFAEKIENLNFLGLIALADEPADDIRDAVRLVLGAGIRPIILTGDHPETARYIANKVGMNVTSEEIVTKTDLAKMPPHQLNKILEKVKIFARITPEDKEEIVELFQKKGYIVAVTGDGTNDAPALKRSDVSFAMGLRGTDVAKDAADIVLSDDHYGTIISALEYGRAIYDNIRNVIVILIAGNFNEVILIMLAFLLSLPVPLLTTQLLWANMISENFTAITLSFEKPSRNVLSQKPRQGNQNSVKSMILYALGLSAISLIFSFGLYKWGLGLSVDKARTLVFCFIVFAEIAYAFSVRSKQRIWQSGRSFLENKNLVISSLALILMQLALFLSPFSRIFNVSPLNSVEWIVLILTVVVSFVFAEMLRFFIDSRKKS